jgi:hypothetical protein
MIMGSVGKVRSFQISTRFVLWAVLFFAAYLLVSLYMINSYLQLSQSSEKEYEKTRQLEEEAAVGKKNLLRTRQHVALLEDYIRRMEGGTEQASSSAKEPSPEEVARAGRSRAPAAALVDVTDMVIQKEGSRITATFKLVNTQPGEGAVGGYVHLVATDRRTTPPREWTYPPEKLQNGLPVNYRNGQIFLINRFKQIQNRFSLGSASESPGVLRLLVYDQAGDIILQREFEVAPAS